MRALVTGAAGFIGSHLSERLLSEGWEVLGVDNFSDYYPRWIKERNLEGSGEQPSFRFLEADLAATAVEPLLEGVDCVFHLAAQAGVRRSWGQAFDRYLHDNLLATQRLLEAARGRGLRKLVFASSSSIYGDAEAYPTAESTVPLPISPYGLTKLAGENLCRLYHRSDGVPAVSLRFFTVYGPRQRPDMAFHIFGRALLTGEPLNVFGDGSQSREFTYVDDVVDGIVRAAAHGHAGEAYNLGGGSEVTLNRAIELLQLLSGERGDVRYGERQPGDARRTAADIVKARRELGFEPRVGLEEGLAREVAWLRELLSSESGVMPA